MICYKCNRNIPEYSLVCPVCGAEMSHSAREKHQMRNMNINMNYRPFGGTSMLWYNILIMFYLFVEAFISASSGIQYIIGFLPEILKKSGDIIYYFQINDTLRFIDVVYGLFFVGMAVLAIVARIKLAGYKKEAPLFVLLFFSLPTVINIIYAVPLMVMTSCAPYEYFSLVFQVGVQAVFVYANYVYFKKRKTLFVN